MTARWWEVLAVAAAVLVLAWFVGVFDEPPRPGVCRCLEGSEGTAWCAQLCGETTPEDPSRSAAANGGT